LVEKPHPWKRQAGIGGRKRDVMAQQQSVSGKIAVQIIRSIDKKI